MNRYTNLNDKHLDVDWVEVTRRYINEQASSPDLPPALTEAEVKEAEERLGYPLPKLMRQLYMNVGNGGFGPGLGFLPLLPIEEEGESVTSIVEADRETDQDGILQFYMPLFKWDENGYGYMHLEENDNHVMIADNDYLQDEFDRNKLLADQYPIIASTLEGLMQDWLAGKPMTAESYGMNSQM
ncbi:hypothetical protein DNH61_04005 [Paenibacillus sambharensis]|uniref:Knr4/Smi1-like domain-containing protein n=1 Tax=Paenibacillus sambharensis TaxID=1803190 RepID=A0A2W1M009_9BACL|nr:SMI1/KNR4 family protein [Paenibacillus sambharensis]PZD97067.1 hypothetical protein DNH61_04005 [Paenibacillus sambharensis]